MNGSNKSIGEIILTSLSTVAIVGGLILWFWRVHDKRTLLIRLAATTPVAVVMFLVVFPTFRAGGLAQIGALFIVVALGWILAIIWVPAIAGSLGKLFGNLYDGGSAEIEPKPLFSIFHSKRARGNYQEALAEIRRQLDRFPTDFEGLMLLAELQAENLNDLPGAEITVQRLCAQPGHAPINISYSLNRLADWHLSLHKDREAAQRDLEKIIEFLPETEMSLQAAQRIGRLADTDSLLASHDRQRIAVKKGVENLGLLRENGKLKPPVEDLDKAAADYVEHLQRHPHDSHAREKLAVIYADHFHRLDLATDQLEQLVRQPNQTSKQIVHWLNLLADLQVREGATLEQVSHTIQMIIDLYPDAASAGTARRRLDTVKLELRAKEKRQGVQLGAYEQNIGLKRNT